MNRLKLSLDNYTYPKQTPPRKRKPIRRDLFKQWVRQIDVDYQKKFGKDDFYIDHYKKFELYPDKPRLPLQAIHKCTVSRRHIELHKFSLYVNVKCPKLIIRYIQHLYVDFEKRNIFYPLNIALGTKLIIK